MDPLTAMKQQSVQQQQQGGGAPGAPLQTYLNSSVTPAPTTTANTAAPTNPLAAHPLSTPNPLARASSPQPTPLTSDPLRAVSPAPVGGVRQAAPVAASSGGGGGGSGERVPVTPHHDPLAAVRQQAPTARPPNFTFTPSSAAQSGSPATTPSTAHPNPYTTTTTTQSLTSPQPSPTSTQPPPPRPAELTDEQRLDAELRAFFGGEVPVSGGRAGDEGLRADKVSRDEAGIVRLAEAGKWREVVKLCESLLQLPPGGGGVGGAGGGGGGGGPSFLTTTVVLPHVVLRYHSYLVSALLKLKRPADAHTALTRVGPFFTTEKFYQSYPELYGESGRQGSMIPFVLHLSRAELGYYEGDVRKTVDALTGLREYVAATVAKRADEERAGRRHDESADDWRERYHTVSTKLADYYMMLAPPDYTSAVHVLATLLSPPTAAAAAAATPAQREQLWYQLGRVHLQAGDVDAASSCFASAAGVSADSPASASTSAVHRSLVLLATGEYKAAQALLAPFVVGGGDGGGGGGGGGVEVPSPTLVNNYALACLYLNELVEARRAVEAYLREDAVRRMDGGLLAVLRVLYDIGNMGSKKKLVEALALMYGSDDLEIA